MKTLILSLGLLLAGRVGWGQQFYTGPEVSTPVKWGQKILLHSPDSAKIAYSKVVRSILAAGYGMDKSDKDALFFSTSAKSLDGSVSLILHITATPTPTGCDIIFRGVYTWLSAATIMAHVENRQLPVQYIGKGNSATQRAWLAMNEVAMSALSGTSIGYK